MTVAGRTLTLWLYSSALWCLVSRGPGNLYILDGRYLPLSDREPHCSFSDGHLTDVSCVVDVGLANRLNPSLMWTMENWIVMTFFSCCYALLTWWLPSGRFYSRRHRSYVLVD